MVLLKLVQNLIKNASQEFSNLRFEYPSDQSNIHNLLFLKLILLLNPAQDSLLTGLLSITTYQKTLKMIKSANLHLSSQDELVQYVVSLLKVEDDVQLTDRSKILVQHLNIPEE